MTNRILDVVGLIVIRESRLLLVRSRGKSGFYLPGGKIEGHESSREALHRETREELGVELLPSSVSRFATYTAKAFEEPEDTLVNMETFRARLKQEPSPSGEIQEIGYYTADEYRRMSRTAPVVELLIEDLQSKQLVEK